MIILFFIMLFGSENPAEGPAIKKRQAVNQIFEFAVK